MEPAMGQRTSAIPDRHKDEFEDTVRAFRKPTLGVITLQGLGTFLEGTEHINASAGSRLRWLAISLENEPFERGWEDLRAIYETAAAADPNDEMILHSWGISATLWMEDWMTPGLPERVTIAAEAERVLMSALELAPKDAGIAHTLGLLYYNHPNRREDNQHRARASPLPERGIGRPVCKPTRGIR